MTDAPAPLTLDQLLVEEAQRCTTEVTSNPFAGAQPWATLARVTQANDAASGLELHLDGLLGALSILYGPTAVVGVRDAVDGLEALIHTLADIATEALAADATDRAVVAELRAARERARSVVVLLEGALSASDERERRVRGVLADVVRDGVNGDAADVTPEAREAHVYLARRLRLALDFDAPADPGQVAEQPVPEPLES